MVSGFLELEREGRVGEKEKACVYARRDREGEGGERREGMCLCQLCFLMANVAVSYLP